MFSAPLPPNTQFYQCRKELYHHLPLPNGAPIAVGHEIVLGFAVLVTSAFRINDVDHDSNHGSSGAAFAYINEAWHDQGLVDQMIHWILVIYASCHIPNRTGEPLHITKKWSKINSEGAILVLSTCISELGKHLP